MEAFKPTDIMIDIETFGLRPRGLVVSVGAVAFDSRGDRARFGGPRFEFHAALSMEAAKREQQAGRFESHEGTLRWWREDNKDAYAKLAAMMEASDLDMRGLMKAFAAWAEPLCAGGAKVWGNAPSFDLVLMENACKETGVRFVVPFRSEGDYRTLMDQVYGADKPKGAPAGHHDALADARFQAQCCCRALASLRAWKDAAPALDWRGEGAQPAPSACVPRAK